MGVLLSTVAPRTSARFRDRKDSFHAEEYTFILSVSADNTLVCCGGIRCSGVDHFIGSSYKTHFGRTPDK